MPRIRRILGLAAVELPDITTVCARMETLKMPVWRELIQLPAELHDTDEIQAIDETGMDRVAASQHYAKRTNYTFRAVKTTSLIDCETSAILDIYCSMKQPHDSKVTWQLITRHLEKQSVLNADKF